MRGLDGGRLSIGACSLGAGRAALTCAAAYTQERKQFGKPIASNQALQFKLADMSVALHSSRLVLRNAAALLDKLKVGEADPSTVTVACAMAKVTATDAGFKVCLNALSKRFTLLDLFTLGCCAGM